MIIRGASGLGDAIYLYPIVKYFCAKYNEVIVLNNYPIIFKNLNCRVKPYNENIICDVDCNYKYRKSIKSTSQFKDMCIEAGVKKEIALKIDIKGIESEYEIDKSVKMCLVKAPCPPFGGKGHEEFIPNKKIIERLIGESGNQYEFVLIGHKTDYDIKGVDIDLRGETSVEDLLFLVNNSDMIISQCGFMLAMAEALDKKCLIIFSKASLTSGSLFIKTIVPEKVITKKTSRFSYDNNNFLKLNTDTKPVKYNTVNQAYLSKLTKGKRVIILGSAPNVLNNNSRHIESYDVVVRLNNYNIKDHKKELGTRVDIYYSYFGTSIKKTMEDIKKDNVKFLWYKYPDHDFNEPLIKDNFKWVYEYRRNLKDFKCYIPTPQEFLDNYGLLGRVLTTGMSAIMDILKYSPKELYVTGFDFFESKVHNINAAWKEGDGNHDNSGERVLFGLLKHFYKNIIVDGNL